jgi:hypothetical protein
MFSNGYGYRLPGGEAASRHIATGSPPEGFGSLPTYAGMP